MNDEDASGGTSAPKAPGIAARRPDRADRLPWAAIMGAVAILLCLPFLRTVTSLGDEGELLNGAEAILAGKRIYADFFEFLPPGGFLLTAAWLKTAGVSLMSARALAVLTVAGIAIFTYLATRLASGHAAPAFLLTLGWLAMSQGAGTLVSHHWMTTLFAAIALWAGLAGRTGFQARRWAGPVIAGLAAGASAMIVPTRGALATLAGLAAFWPPRPRRHAGSDPGPCGTDSAGCGRVRRLTRPALIYCAAVSLVPLSLLGLVICQGSVAAAFQDVIYHTGTRYASIQYLPFGSRGDVRNYPLALVFPLTGILLAVVAVRDRRLFPRERLARSAAAYAAAGFVGCFPRPDLFHIAFGVPLALPCLSWCLTSLTRGWKPWHRLAAAASAIGVCAPALASFWWIAHSALHHKADPSARGDIVWFMEPETPAMLARIAAVPPGERFFFYPFLALLPFLTGREQMSDYDVFTAEYSAPAEYQAACDAVLPHANWLVIDRMMTDPVHLKLLYPAMRDARPPEVEAFERALDQGFDFVARDGRLELRHRRPDASITSCLGIAPPDAAPARPQ